LREYLKSTASLKGAVVAWVTVQIDPNTEEILSLFRLHIGFGWQLRSMEREGVAKYVHLADDEIAPHDISHFIDR